MSFGQQSGPPASAKQVAYLESLLGKAGHSSFRDARGPLGLTQRQAGGKFTTREASELIERLLAERPQDDDGESGAASSRRPATAANRRSSATRSADSAPVTHEAPPGRPSLRSIPVDDLVAELRRRGWELTPPPDPM